MDTAWINIASLGGYLLRDMRNWQIPISYNLLARVIQMGNDKNKYSYCFIAGFLSQRSK